MATGRFLPSRLSKAVPRELGTSTGMTAVQSLSFAQCKSEQNKIVIAKAGYHYGSGILPFAIFNSVSILGFFTFLFNKSVNPPLLIPVILQSLYLVIFFLLSSSSKKFLFIMLFLS